MDEPGFTLNEARVCIVGLGLMGGSLALALRPHVREILAVDPAAETRAKALRDGTADRAGESLDLAGDADLVVLATPMRTLVRQVGELAAILKPGAVLMDLGSVKEPVVEAMNALPQVVAAVAGHPMCGKEVSGLEHADASLFRGARFVLCRTDRTTAGAWRLANELAATIGSEAVEMEADHHDKAAAAISHLPYLMAAATAYEAGSNAFDPFVWRLAGSGFRDTSRLAGSDPGMMADILMTNDIRVMTEIAGVQVYLQSIHEALMRRDYKALCGALSVAKSFRREWEESQRK